MNEEVYIKDTYGKKRRHVFKWGHSLTGKTLRLHRKIGSSNLPGSTKN